MTQGGSILKADQIELFRKKRQAVATGNVHLIDPEVEIWASKANVDIVKETLELYDAKVRSRKSTYNLQGKKIYKLEGQNYAVLNGFFTTCDTTKGEPDWAISADHMDVDIGSTGTARGVPSSSST